MEEATISRNTPLPADNKCGISLILFSHAGTLSGYARLNGKSRNPMPITFITDKLPGELEILAPIRHHSLRIQDLNGEEIATFPSPSGGWTHSMLVETAQKLPLVGVEGADAYLGEDWVGSTEV